MYVWVASIPAPAPPAPQASTSIAVTPAGQVHVLFPVVVMAVETEEVITKVRVAEPVVTAFVALIVALNVPAAVGVPVIAPVLVLTLKPAGNPVAE